MTWAKCAKRWTVVLLVAAIPAEIPSAAQHRPMQADAPAASSDQPKPARTRLILKDGTYQLVLSYQVLGGVVRYRSAERNGALEEIPVELVDLPATELWEKEHTPGAVPGQPAVLSPELAREEAARAARTPQIAPDLRLPEEDTVLALDTFRGTPELVPLAQAGSDLNRETGHALKPVDVNPASSPHRVADIPEERADVQLHVAEPVFFVRVDRDDQANAGGHAITVDTHGAADQERSAQPRGQARYVIERVDVRRGLRELDSFSLAQLGSDRKQPDVIECRAEPLPGGQWLKLTPAEPLLFGEYALVEVLPPRSMNVAVWDFGVHSDAKENSEAIHPEARKPAQLERRRR